MNDTVTIGMTTDQWQTLIGTLKEIAQNLPLDKYTLIGAQDWYWIVILAVAFSIWSGYVWRDLKAGQTRTENLVKELQHEQRKEDEKIWDELRACQEKCQRRRKDDQ